MNHLVLFVFLVLLPPVLPTGNRTDFRVANGLPVVDMNKENYGHLVHIFVVVKESAKGKVVMKTKDVPKLQYGHSCTGMLVTSGQLQGEQNLPKTAMADYVLTAGHCVNWNSVAKKLLRKNNVEHPHHIYVVSGSELAATPALKWQRSKKSYKLIFKHVKQGAQVVQVTWASYNYTNETGKNVNQQTGELSDVFDIAILKLAKKLNTPVIPFQFDDNLKPGAKGSRDQCRFAGWGVDGKGRSDDKLKKVQENGMERYTEMECKLEYVRRHTHDNMGEECIKTQRQNAVAYAKTSTCTRHKGGSVPCFGDSGGPFLCRHKNDDGTYSEEKVVGVTSTVVGIAIDRSIKCFGLPKTKSVTCHDQKKSAVDVLSQYQRISEAETKAYLKKCEKVIANPESAEDKAKTECFAKQYGSLEVEITAQ